MRILSIIAGIAILFMSMHIGHSLYYQLTHHPHHHPAFIAGMTAATAGWALSLIGGCLLLLRAR